MTDRQLDAADVLKIECRARDLVSIEKAGRADAFRIDRSIMLEDDVPALIAALKEAVGLAEALDLMMAEGDVPDPKALAAFLDRWKGL